MRPSIDGVGDAYDNAMAKRFFASLEWNLLIDAAYTPKPKRDGRVLICAQLSPVCTEY